MSYYVIFHLPSLVHCISALQCSVMQCVEWSQCSAVKFIGEVDVQRRGLVGLWGGVITIVVSFGVRADVRGGHLR